MDKQQISLAEKTFLALLNPYDSVDRTFPLALRQAEGDDAIRYVGVKGRVQIPTELIRALRPAGFVLHTVDRQSLGGRAVDVRMTNPLTGRHMTGSSSGTAVNVFLGINDLGIGTDGGGSVLAPAASLNLYALMSPLVCHDWLAQFPNGKSTDGISFLSSIGFMARDLETIADACAVAPGLELGQLAASSASAASLRLAVQAEAEPFLGDVAAGSHDVVPAPPFSAGRREQLDFLQGALADHDVVVTLEGPVDVNGMGDTVFGHFDEGTGAVQAAACKGIVKVANMARATALVVPVPRLATALLLACRSEPVAIARMLELARSLPPYADELCGRYFRDLAKYACVGFGEVDYRLG